VAANALTLIWGKQVNGIESARIRSLAGTLWST
jgi:hypothetical protein